MTSALPANSTEFERALESVILENDALSGAVDLLRTAKEAPPDDWLRALVWEYGLDELLPYFDDMRALLAEGVDWSRIRGTPASIVQALSWLDYGSIPTIEEEETGGAHWFEFQIDPGGVPDNYQQIQGIAALARLSAPVGTHLSRIFHGYDVRRFVLDNSEWGALLSDYSGIYDDDLALTLSFGRNADSAATLGDDPAISAGHSRSHLTIHKYEDRIYWDFGRYGESHVINHHAMHSHLFQVAGQGVIVQQNSADTMTLPRAAILLSDGSVLGDTNASLFAVGQVEIGAPLPLSDGLVLSGEPWRIVKYPIDERFDRSASVAVGYDFTPSASVMVEAVYNSSTFNGHAWDANPWDSRRWSEITVFTRHLTDGDTP